MCLWGVSPIRLIHKPTAGTTKIPLLSGVFVFNPHRGTFHCGKEPDVAVFIRCQRRYHAPEVHSPIIADFSHDHFDFSALDDSNDAPITHPLGLPDPLLMTFDFKFL